MSAIDLPESAHAAEFRPETLAEAGEFLRESARSCTAVEITGSGTAGSWGGTVSAEKRLSTLGLADVVRYEPADMTIQAGAGLPVSRLQQIVGERGQRLALDPPRIADGATVGGLLATADQGPGQLAFGGPRDHVIGATLVFADGSIARSGGHVIKNVAGYDLARMVSGSLGTLALLAEVTFRLHPLPAATGTAVLSASISDARLLARAVFDAQLEPCAAEWHDDTLLIRYEGSPFGVTERLAATRRLLGSDSRAVSGDDETTIWANHAQVTAPEHGRACAVLRGLVRPSQAADAVHAALFLGTELEADVSVTTGLLTGRVDIYIGGGRNERDGEFVCRWRQQVELLGGSTMLRQHHPELCQVVEPWGSPPSAIALMRAVKRAFDPEDRLGRGRFGTWLDQHDADRHSQGRKA